MSNSHDRFGEIDKRLRRHRLRSHPDISFMEDGVERILRENMFDVGDEQFLVLLLVVNSENDERLQLAQKSVVARREEIVDMPVDRRAIAMRFRNRGT